MTSAELADAAGLDERWVREWAYNQAAAKLIHASEPDGDELRFTLTAEAAAVLAAPDHPAFGMGMFHRLPQTMQTLERMPESFRSGVGHDYDSHGPEGAVGIERSFEPWNRAFLLPAVLPALEGVVDKLTAGATVIDIGCGAGGAVLLMAGAYPASRFTGYDISQYALRRAEEKRAEADATNVVFHDPRQHPMPEDHSVDLVTTFDCIHDMTDPQGMMGAIRRADRRRRHVAARRHQGAGHVRRERREEPDGTADVRHQRAVVHVVGAVGARRGRARHARAAGVEGRGDGPRRRVHPVPQARRRPRRERVLRDPTVR